MYFKEDELLETRSPVFVSAISLLGFHSAVAQLKQNLTIQRTLLASSAPRTELWLVYS